MSDATPLTDLDGARASAVFIGEGSLLAQCADAFLSAGREIRAVVTETPVLLEWAAERGLATIAPGADLYALLSLLTFDFLFSVANLRILPPPVLALPRRLAVNYHDAPLPSYAGLHATSWALARREPVHGITWHTMVGDVDAGEVIRRVTFPVAPRETALSLNASCYEAALAAFKELLPELVAGTAVLEPQGEAGRSYFGRFRRPRAASVLDWSRPAAELDALVRALDFGPYENPLGLPKLLCPDGSVVAVQKATPEPAAAVAPGTVLAADARSLTVAAAGGALRLQRLATLDGAPLDAAALAGRGALPGAQLPLLDPELAQRLTELQRAVSKHEPAWVTRLAAVPASSSPALAPFARARGASGDEAVVEQALPADIAAGIESAVAEEPPSVATALALASFIATLYDGAPCDVAYRDEALRALVAGLPPLFASVVPLRAGEAGHGGATTLAALRDELARVHRAGTYALDVCARMPALRARARAGEARPPAVALCVHGPSACSSEEPAAPLQVCVEDAGRALRWRSATAAKAALAALASRFLDYAAGVAASAPAVSMVPTAR